MFKEIDWDKVNAKKHAALQKRRAKLSDPQYRQQQYDKANKKNQKKLELKREKESTEEFRQKKLDQARAAQLRAMEKQKAKPSKSRSPQKSIPKKKPSKGMAGRAPTSMENQIMNQIGSLPCICCLLKGEESLDGEHGYISLHHTDGRTKTLAHAKVLPLCQYHHDQPPPKDAPAWLFPIHNGIGKKIWESENGTQDYLLALVYQIIGKARPWIEGDRNHLEYCSLTIQ